MDNITHVPIGIPTSVLFAPDDISGLQLWLDAAQGVVVTGSDVDSWTDQSTNGHVLTASGAGRPTLNASAINGYPSIEFTPGVNNHFDVPDPIKSGTSDWTFVMCIQIDTGPSTRYIFDTATGRMVLKADDALGQLGFFDGGWKAEVATTNPYQILTFHLGTGGQIRRNGTQISSNPSFTDQAISGTTKLGSHNDGTVSFDGELAEFLVYDSYLSSANLTTVEDYLMTKYGIR